MTPRMRSLVAAGLLFGGALANSWLVTPRYGEYRDTVALSQAAEHWNGATILHGFVVIAAWVAGAALILGAFQKHTTEAKPLFEATPFARFVCVVELALLFVFVVAMHFEYDAMASGVSAPLLAIGAVVGLG